MTEAFEEELRQAISGEDFENYGLKEDPFIISKKSHFFNRDDEKKILPRQISRLGKGKTEHIAITGERGIGSNTRQNKELRNATKYNGHTRDLK